MSQWVRIGALAEMPAEGRAKAFDARGTAVCVACIRGRLAAMYDECPHRGALLSEGTVEDGRLVCSWHGWSFDPVTGAELHNPLGAAKVFPLRIVGDDVLCDV